MAQVMIDGFSTRISFGDCALTVCPKTVTPPAVDGGEMIDISGMYNDLWRTKAPKSLLDLGPCTFMAAYDPVIYNEAAVLLFVNSVQFVGVIFPDGSSIFFWAAINKVEPQESKEGEQPMVQVTMTPTNWAGNFSSDGCPIEAGPVYFAPNALDAKGNFRVC